jgi:hypothetical protein
MPTLILYLFIAKNYLCKTSNQIKSNQKPTLVHYSLRCACAWYFWPCFYWPFLSTATMLRIQLLTNRLMAPITTYRLTSRPLTAQPSDSTDPALTKQATPTALYTDILALVQQMESSANDATNVKLGLRLHDLLHECARLGHDDAMFWLAEVSYVRLASRRF